MPVPLAKPPGVASNHIRETLPIPFVLQQPEEQTDNWDDDFEEGISLTKLQGMYYNNVTDHVYVRVTVYNSAGEDVCRGTQAGYHRGQRPDHPSWSQPHIWPCPSTYCQSAITDNSPNYRRLL